MTWEGKKEGDEGPTHPNGGRGGTRDGETRVPDKLTRVMKFGNGYVAGN